MCIRDRFKGKWINTATGADAINAANSTSTGYFTRKYFDGYYTKGMSCLLYTSSRNPAPTYPTGFPPKTARRRFR